MCMERLNVPVICGDKKWIYPAKKRGQKCIFWQRKQCLLSYQNACSNSKHLDFRPPVMSKKYIHWGSLQWRHNDHDSVSNHRRHDCLLSRLFRRRSKKTSKLRVTGHCEGNRRWPVDSPHKGPMTRKMFPFNDVIMILSDRRFGFCPYPKFNYGLVNLCQ